MESGTIQEEILGQIGIKNSSRLKKKSHLLQNLYQYFKVMSELLKRLQVFYEKQEISAEDFHCRYYSSCKSGYNDFTEAKGTFLSSGYEKSIPRLLFISLDPGREEFYRQPTNRTLLNVQKYESERNITSLPKNRHWYRTVELACTILKRFKGYQDLQINQEILGSALE